MAELVRFYSNAGVPPKPDKELMEKIASLEEVDFEGVAQIIREHKNKKRSHLLIREKLEDKLTI